MKKHAVILLMAGSSSRFESTSPKQFIKVKGKPLYTYSLEQFIQCSFDQILLVCPKSHPIEPSSQYTRIEGGKSRQESVFLGLQALDSSIVSVTIHDAARALVSQNLILKHKKAAQKFDAITTHIPVTDTIYQVQGQIVESIIDRDKLRIGQTPQTFKRSLLEEAHLNFKGEATDDAMMVHSLGQQLHLIDGEVNNFKITYPNDLRLFEQILSEKKL